MSFAYRPISRALALAFGGVAGVVLIAPDARAQQQAAGESQKLERVEVTGSLIRRIDTEMALPVVNLNVSELQKAGASNAEQALSFVTQNQVGTPTSRSVSGTNGGAAYANLRNLGSSRTLVLLNGKRIVNQPYSAAAVDLNTLPSVALDRIEVLADGASAIYGTDAIAGVVNFITRKEYEGVSVGGKVQIPEQGGGEVYLANLLGGYGNLSSQGWNVYGGLTFRRQQPLNGTERGFMETSYIPSRGFNATSPITFPGSYSQTVSGRSTVPTTKPVRARLLSTVVHPHDEQHGMLRRYAVVDQRRAVDRPVVALWQGLFGFGSQQHAVGRILLGEPGAVQPDCTVARIQRPEHVAQ